jgi:hypothetical protein
MAVRVDEPGDEGAPLGVDDGVGIRVEAAAHGVELAVGDEHGIAVQEWRLDIARHDLADILDQGPHRSGVLIA